MGDIHSFMPGMGPSSWFGDSKEIQCLEYEIERLKNENNKLKSAGIIEVMAINPRVDEWVKEKEKELVDVRQKLIDELAKNALAPTGVQRLEAAERRLTEHDNLAVDAWNRLKKEIDERWWLTEGRGDFAYNDDRYRDEFHYALEAMRNIVDTAIRKTNPAAPALGLYDPKFGDDRVCNCGHTYRRHFDTYDDMRPVGCKYCGCQKFAESPAPAAKKCECGKSYLPDTKGKCLNCGRPAPEKGEKA